MSVLQTLRLSRGTAVLILVMLGVVTAGILIAWFHYAAINEAEDPRVLEAKLLYKDYNQAIRDNDANKALLLLDSIEAIYTKWPDYARSYEVGVVYNNRAAIYLSLLLHSDNDPETRDSLGRTAEYWAEQSIRMYQGWLDDFSSSSEDALRLRAQKWYVGFERIYPEVDAESIIAKRIDELLLAQTETPRRLSVAYTNLGIVLRHQGDYEGAMQCYREALALWEANRNAQNNIRILLGQPVKEPSFIEKLFPEDKNK